MLSIKTATVHSISTTSDHGLRIVLLTRELPAEEMAALFMAKALGTESIKIEEPATDDLKTPGQRLRGVLFRVWENTTRETDFETYYREEMTRIINHYKDKLP